MPGFHACIYTKLFHFRQVKVAARSWVAYSFVTTYALHLPIPWGHWPYIMGLAQDHLRETSPEFTRFNGGINRTVYRRWCQSY
jgi:hypothetical protein